MNRLLFAMVVGLVCGRPAAQDLSSVFPALKTLPAPAGIEEGVRLSYYGSVGDIPNEDYDKWGGTLGQWDYATAPSGHGYTQVDVVAVTQGLAALSVQAWQYSNWTGPLIPVRGGQSGLVCHAGGGDWWVHPQVLASLQETSDPEFTILRAVQTLDGKSYAVIRVQRVAEKSRDAVVYDMKTGLLLFRGTAYRTEDTTFASQMFYKGSRKLPHAARPLPLPLWLEPGLAFEYQGEYISQVWGNPPFGLPLAALIEIRAVGDGWFVYDQTTTLSSLWGMPPTVETATLVGGGNIYVAPQVLRGFRAGTVLDTDPITGCQLSVVEAGTTVVMRATVGTVSVTEFRYDAGSGLMTGFRSWDSTDPILELSSVLDLTQMPDLTAVAPPTLKIGRRGAKIVMTCPDGHARLYPVQASVDGGPWETVGQVSSQLEWETSIDPARRLVLFRLQP